MTSPAADRRGPLQTDADRLEGAGDIMKNPNVVWVTGDTTWTDEAWIREQLSKFPAGTVLLTGGAKGADTIAEAIGRQRGFLVVTVPYVKTLGRAGGPVRNALICKIGRLLSPPEKPPTCLAFGDDRGTRGSVKLAQSGGYEVVRIGETKE